MRSSAIYEDSKKLQWNVATQHKARNDIDYFTTRAQNDYVYIQTGTMRLQMTQNAHTQTSDLGTTQLGRSRPLARTGKNFPTFPDTGQIPGKSKVFWTSGHPAHEHGEYLSDNKHIINETIDDQSINQTYTWHR